MFAKMTLLLNCKTTRNCENRRLSFLRVVSDSFWKSLHGLVRKTSLGRVSIDSTVETRADLWCFHLIHLYTPLWELEGGMFLCVFCGFLNASVGWKNQQPGMHLVTSWLVLCPVLGSPPSVSGLHL